MIFVFALFVPGSEGLGLGLTKNNHHQVYGVGEHLPILRHCDSRGGADRGGGRAGRQWVMSVTSPVVTSLLGPEENPSARPSVVALNMGRKRRNSKSL